MSSSHFMPLAVSLLLVVVLTTCPTVVSAGGGFRCPNLRQAIANYADWNSTELGWHWFMQRGFSTSKLFGCRSRSGNYPTRWWNDTKNANGSMSYLDAGRPSPFHFALGCECPAWSVCGGDPFQYEHNDGYVYTTPMGECGCCAWWVIFVPLLGAFLILLLIFNWKALRVLFYKHVLKKKYRRGSSRHFTDLEGSGEEPSGAHTDSAEMMAVGASDSSRSGYNASSGNLTKRSHLYINDDVESGRGPKQPATVPPQGKTTAARRTNSSSSGGSGAGLSSSARSNKQVEFGAAAPAGQPSRSPTLMAAAAPGSGAASPVRSSNSSLSSLPSGAVGAPAAPARPKTPPLPSHLQQQVKKASPPPPPPPDATSPGAMPPAPGSDIAEGSATSLPHAFDAADERAEN